ncbi:isochorismate synthase [Buchananella hordeovulneris]|uniref:isochorismate synthase n=1 Tax=Buchananella hordeovulneris TaxID=52770 RepID=UPI0016399B3E|nr:isochorismate synthase [Buchananella hordeovulneris]
MNTAPVLHAATVDITDHPALPCDLLELASPSPTTVTWLRDGDGFVGVGRVADHQANGAGRFAELSAWWRAVAAQAHNDDPVQLFGSGLLACGSAAFAPTSERRSRLVVPRVVVGRRAGRAWLTVIDSAPVASPRPDAVLAQLRAAHTPPTTPSAPRTRPGALRRSQWQAAVGEAIELLRAGKLAKVVLARDLAIDFAAPLDVRSPLGSLTRTYPNCWTFAIDGLLGATPEMLVRLDQGLVTCRVLAGTIHRTGDDDADAARAGSLARSSKNLAEHEYAVQSVADALASHCATLNVPEHPFVLQLANVMHLATDVTGVLPAGSPTSSLQLAAALHPSAAVGGTPRAAALAQIARLEKMDREAYAAPVGWLGADGNGEWGIALRCGQLSPDGRSLRLFAGGGVLAESDPAAELAETEAKMRPMLTAVGLAH